MNLVETFLAQVRERPDALALIGGSADRPQHWTNRRLNQASILAAKVLQRFQLTEGDRVMVMHPLSPELYVLLIALFRLGLVAVFPDLSAGLKRTAESCRRLRPHALAGPAKVQVWALTQAATREVPLRLNTGNFLPGVASLPLNSSGEPEWDADWAVERQPGDPALITFTSGGTGEPKTVVRTHGLLLAQHRAIEASLGLSPGEVELCALPVFVLANLGSGLTTVLPDADLRRPGGIKAAPVLRQLRAFRPDRVIASPAFLEQLLFGSRETPDPAFSCVKTLLTGGAPVFPALLERLSAKAPQAEILSVYGSTEAEPIAHYPASALSRADREAILRGAGLPAGPPDPSVHLAILPDRWGEPIPPYPSEADLFAAALPPGVPGEIAVSGDHVLPGYLDGIGDEETKFRVGGRVWHRTGDAGYLDPEGRLWLLGRCAAKTPCADGFLYPFAVEAAVADLPGIRRAALVNADGRSVLAIEPIRGADPPDPETLQAAIRARLAWAPIDAIRLVPKLPVDRRHNAKIDYPALRRLFQDKPARR